MNRFFPILLVFAALILNVSCSESQGSKPKPAAKTTSNPKYTVFNLPPELKEISGIAFLDSVNVLAIEDEDGVIYQYDLARKKIVKTMRFAGKGDYEDLAIVDKNVYVVDSSGDLYFVSGFFQGTQKTEKIKTSLKNKNDVEGLAYDPVNKRLLLAAKAKGMSNKVDKDIFQFNFATNVLDPVPVASIKTTDIEKYFKGDAIEESSKKFLKALGNENLTKVFTTSAIAIHPVTGELYALSSANRLIAILDKTGKITRIVRLKGKDFSQPEGLSFSPAHVLYVSNEGKKRLPNIIRIDHE